MGEEGVEKQEIEGNMRKHVMARVTVEEKKKLARRKLIKRDK